MTFLEYLLEIDDIGTAVQGQGGSIAGVGPLVLPQGSIDNVRQQLDKRKKNETTKITNKRTRRDRRRTV